MSDSELNENSQSISGGRCSKTCGLCHKTEKEHWRRHWLTKHPKMIRFEEGQPNPNDLQVVPYGAH